MLIFARAGASRIISGGTSSSSFSFSSSSSSSSSSDSSTSRPGSVLRLGERQHDLRFTTTSSLSIDVLRHSSISLSLQLLFLLSCTFNCHCLHDHLVVTCACGYPTLSLPYPLSLGYLSALRFCDFSAA